MKLKHKYFIVDGLLLLKKGRRRREFLDDFVLFSSLVSFIIQFLLFLPQTPNNNKRGRKTKRGGGFERLKSGGGPSRRLSKVPLFYLLGKQKKRNLRTPPPPPLFKQLHFSTPRISAQLKRTPQKKKVAACNNKRGSICPRRANCFERGVPVSPPRFALFKSREKTDRFRRKNIYIYLLSRYHDAGARFFERRRRRAVGAESDSGGNEGRSGSWCTCARCACTCARASRETIRCASDSFERECAFNDYHGSRYREEICSSSRDSNSSGAKTSRSHRASADIEN